MNWADFDNLTDGEWRVFEFFDRHLAPDWEIYIQPHLNGLRTDFVLLNPKVGIAVFEVKDWNLNTMRYWVEEAPGQAPMLWARRDDRDLSTKAETRSRISSATRKRYSTSIARA